MLTGSTWLPIDRAFFCTISFERNAISSSPSLIVQDRRSCHPYGVEAAPVFVRLTPSHTIGGLLGGSGLHFSADQRSLLPRERYFPEAAPSFFNRLSRIAAVTAEKRDLLSVQLAVFQECSHRRCKCIGPHRCSNHNSVIIRRIMLQRLQRRRALTDKLTKPPHNISCSADM